MTTHDPVRQLRRFRYWQRFAAAALVVQKAPLVD
jgi:hypothetical protein